MADSYQPMNDDTQRWVVYACFDAEGTVTPFAIEQVLAYRALGFETLVVDTSPTLSIQRADGWVDCSTRWMRRQNEGYDFGSYRAGLQTLLDETGLPASRLDILFTNDSCYGPFGSLADIFARFDAYPRKGRHVFGLTDTQEHGYHLQSYWLYFRADVLTLAADFFSAAPDISDRAEAVRNGEIGLSRFLLERGCQLVAYRPLAEVVAHFAAFRPKPLALLELALRWRLKRPRYSLRGDKICLKSLLGRPYTCNPTIAFGTHLCFEGWLPFLKRQLVRENPDQDPFLPEHPPSDARDNSAVNRWLRGTKRYRRRYGH